MMLQRNDAQQGCHTYSCCGMEQARDPTPSGDALVTSARNFRVNPGRPLPLGVHDCCDGFNFAIFSRHAKQITLLLFDTARDSNPLLVVELDPVHHRTGDIWHVLIDGVRWGQAYTFRVSGPWAPERGHRFDSRILLLDPYALALEGPPSAAQDVEGAVPGGQRCLLVNRRFDWQGVVRPQRPWSETIICETHVRGLTIHPSAAVSHPGTFLGLIEKIPYFLDLGITAIELMPVYEFDHQSVATSKPVTSAPARDYWGYEPIALFAPNRAFATAQSQGCQVDEFKTMVRELHRAGLEVILDVVFNHTAEGNEDGPTFNFRGLDNSIYYMLDEDRRHYRDFSGCGNTFNCNHPVVRDYIIDCLQYWVVEMHVDGFRFDLAAILGRDQSGQVATNPPLLEQIAEDPILRDVKLIAEAWDMGGAYQVGSFPGQRWAEWNGRFRDDVRRFWRGDPGMTGALASRLCGSADLYQRSGKEPVNSVNFITSHDGFTLNDLVSYGVKHNEPNGEDNRDGTDENFSANYGVEGPSNDPTVEAIRLRQIKNMLATLLLARGVPMLLGGDEFRRTQHGNNNAYCQDNEISWYDWRQTVLNHDLVRFVRGLIAFRRRNPVLSVDAFYSDNQIAWFGPSGRSPDWDGPTRSLGCLVQSQLPVGTPVQDGAICLLFNAGVAAVEFKLPPPPRTDWRVVFDTSAAAVDEGFPLKEEAPAADQTQYALAPRTLAVLSSR